MTVGSIFLAWVGVNALCMVALFWWVGDDDADMPPWHRFPSWLWAFVFTLMTICGAPLVGVIMAIREWLAFVIERTWIRSRVRISQWRVERMLRREFGEAATPHIERLRELLDGVRTNTPPNESNKP